MEFAQLYLGCLAQASYLVGDAGECAIVDPRRDVDVYVDEAQKRGLTIRYVIETHLHADFVSGHRELADRTGAEILIGAAAGAQFPHRAVIDGDRFTVGSIELVAMETPGHTPESLCWLVVEGGRPRKVLTGDTLFIGDVGRPDLAGGRGYTPEAMAAMLYDSLHQKLLALPDDVEVWPAHGAGSACGKNISRETSSTIGLQRRTNYALAPMSRDEFVRMMVSDLPEPPAYFPRDAEINREGARHLSEVVGVPLSVEEVRSLVAGGAILLDVRDAADYGAEHIPGSVNIGLGGQFASWSGTLLPFDARLVIVADSETRAEEAIMRLARVGIENVCGWLEGGVDSWRSAGHETRSLPQLLPAEVNAELSQLRILDVRGPGEYAGGHIPGALNVPLNQLQRLSAELPADVPTAVVCAGGYRSSAAASLLERAGYRELRNVVGGTSRWIKEGFETE